MRSPDRQNRVIPAPVDIERRLFEISLGKIRLLDSPLEKAGLPQLAVDLRELLADWRAYPSRTVFSTKDLRHFVAKLDRIAAGLQRAGLIVEATLVLEASGQIRGWINGSR